MMNRIQTQLNENMPMSEEEKGRAVRAVADFNNTDGIEVLTASVCGSHARGIANDSSDIDIRCVHVQTEKINYVKLNTPKQTLTRKYDKKLSNETECDEPVTVEIESWDVKKFAKLLAESNHQAIELLRENNILMENPGVDLLREYMIENQNYNRVALYHKYRSHAESNYDAYLSDHLVSNTDSVFRIHEQDSNGYLVESPVTGEELFIPDYAVDMHENMETGEMVKLPAKHLNTDNDNDKHVERKFTTTITEQNVKRNLAVFEYALKARYVAKNGIPPINIRELLEEFLIDGGVKNDACLVVEKETSKDTGFSTDTSLNILKSLIEKKQRGEVIDVGDLAGVKSVIPPKMQGDELSTEPPDETVIDNGVEKMIGSIR